MIETDKATLVRCRSGEKEAFRDIVMTYQRMIFSLALKMTADEDEAKDIVQETFIKAWQNIASYNDKYKMSTWLYTIASRLCLDRIKRNNRTTPMPQDEDFLKEYADDTDGHRIMENQQWISIIKVLVANLSPKQRLVFTLSHFEGLDPNEVKQITGLDVNKIKSNLYVARQTIREQLIKMGYEKY